MNTAIPQLLSASLVSAVFVSSAMGQVPSVQTDSASRINAANEMLRQGMIEEALSGYQQIQPTDANRDQLNYNTAVAQFRHGDLQAAKRLFSDASTSSDAKLASNSRYNLGNCFYSDAVKAAQHDHAAAIQALQEAISHYRGSLAGNPNNVDARANIELAGELLKKLQQDQQQQDQQQQDQQQQDQQQQDQQQQDQQQQDQQQQDQQQQDQQQQDQQQQDQTQQTQSPQQGSPTEPSEAGQNQTDQDDPQKKPDEQAASSDATESDSSQRQSQAAESEPEDQQADQPSDTSADKQADKPADSSREVADDSLSLAEQNRQSPADDRQEPDESANEQDHDDRGQAVPSGDLTAASEQQPSEEPNGRVAVADAHDKDGLMTKEEALKMLQSVRDRDMLRRLRQERIERSRHVPVDRDW